MLRTTVGADPIHNLYSSGTEQVPQGVLAVIGTLSVPELLVYTGLNTRMRSHSSHASRPEHNQSTLELVLKRSAPVYVGSS